jgi:hypothetical protein
LLVANRRYFIQVQLVYFVEKLLLI